MKKSVAIVGLGYVGLPLAVACAKSGFKTFGIDNDASRIEKLLRGESYIEDVTTNSLTEIISSEKFIPSADYSICSNNSYLRANAFNSKKITRSKFFTKCC
jgi:UDP-N-acetyl-D-mannosaminuronate dehydrogenase